MLPLAPSNSSRRPHASRACLMPFLLAAYLIAAGI
jgi:hypothetical protein